MKPAFEKLFGFDSKKNNVRTEILAGITTSSPWPISWP